MYSEAGRIKEELEFQGLLVDLIKVQAHGIHEEPPAEVARTLRAIEGEAKLHLSPNGNGGETAEQSINPGDKVPIGPGQEFTIQAIGYSAESTEQWAGLLVTIPELS